ncbi:Tyrosine-protein phosphatase non-receptor type 13 [Coemansia sp. RSA 1939]|nr:Tyrosine-protein phosphatase non-receptor type 13 [Coemansia sp. RSA 1939]KAJ2618201.1 Tyrosine-protein phosphatase non-receptor type 13 [Coemansia sp. RSA 1804]KAJ2695328.1 Tyrosine-protein phosphatase non-receptor type 13 [Coemansia sp. RSA 1285]
MMSMSFRQLLQELSQKPVQKKLSTVFQETDQKDWTQFRQDMEQAEADGSGRISEAQMGGNYNLNRYSNVVPYNQNRVRLGGKSDYINASHIALPESVAVAAGTRYIATQGPLNHTVGDFWQMVWEQNARTVVMLANPVEANRPKCAVYWPTRVGQTIVPAPSGNGSKVAAVSVTLVDEHSLDPALAPGVTVRSFELRSETAADPRTVRQLHYTDWPDHGVPSSPVSLLLLLKELHSAAGSQPDASAPVVVHCSAGVGRSGTLIVLDAAMRYFAAHDDYAGDLVADVFRSLRAQRVQMVQTLNQFMFCYHAIGFMLSSMD